MLNAKERLLPEHNFPFMVLFLYMKMARIQRPKHI